MGEVQYTFLFQGVTSHWERGGGMDHRVILGVVMRTYILRLDVPFGVNKSQVHISNQSRATPSCIGLFTITCFDCNYELSSCLLEIIQA
jgi:hypothetical protein